jgi:hypothetical protein
MPDQTARQIYLKDYQKQWYVDVVKKRREAWFAANGPCVDCGSWERLELDHDDPSTKVSHVIWGWGEFRRAEELSKCKPRCYDCHKKKSVKENIDRGIYGMHKKKVIEGKVWCNKCEDFLPVENFSKDKHAASGYYAVCKQCRRLYKNRNKSGMDVERKILPAHPQDEPANANYNNSGITEQRID